MSRLGGLAHLECEVCHAFIGCPVTAVSADRYGERIEVNPAPLRKHYEKNHRDALWEVARAERRERAGV